MYDILNLCVGFEWDAGNATKNAEKHGVSHAECEQLFFKKPLLVVADDKHANTEPRFHALGITNDGRKLLVVFTVRKTLIRVISARPMSKKERAVYDKA